MKEKIIKYLKTVFLWIFIVNFIISFLNFTNNIDSYLKPAEITNNLENKSIISEANSIESELNNLTYDLKEKYGENYPALAVTYYQTMFHYSSYTLVEDFLLSLIIGFEIGNIIYFIFIAKYEKYKLFFAILISIVITSIFFELYNNFISIANNTPTKFAIKNMILNIDKTLIPYSILSIMLVIVNKIYKTYIEIRYSND